MVRRKKRQGSLARRPFVARHHENTWSGRGTGPQEHLWREDLFLDIRKARCVLRVVHLHDERDGEAEAVATALRPTFAQRLFDLFVDAFGEHAEGLHSGFVFVIQWCQSKRRLSAQGLALQTDRC